MSRRVKIIFGITAAAVILVFGILFTLQKAGKISFASFADEIVSTSKQLIGQKSVGATVTFSITGMCWPPNTHVTIVGDNGRRYDSVQLTEANEMSVQITGVAAGSYTGDPSNNVYVVPFSISAEQTTASTTGGIVNCDTTGTNSSVSGQITKAGSNLTIPGASIAVGNLPSVSSDSAGGYSIPNIASGTYAVIVTASGYSALTQNITVAAGPNTKNFSLSLAGSTGTPHPILLYVDVKTDCTEASCTNRDAQGKVNGIPVSFGSYSGVTNNSLAQGYNLQFSNVMTGNYTFKINDPSQSGYNPAYESKNVTQNIYDSTGSALTIFTLSKKMALPQATNFDFIGSVKDDQGNLLSGVLVNVQTPVGCTDSPTFSCPWNKSTTSGNAPTNTHGVTTQLNFSKTGLYNVAQNGSHFSSYAGTIGKTGYQTVNFTISASDINVDAHGSSYFSKDVVMAPLPKFVIAGEAYYNSPDGSKHYFNPGDITFKFNDQTISVTGSETLNFPKTGTKDANYYSSALSVSNQMTLTLESERWELLPNFDFTPSNVIYADPRLPGVYRADIEVAPLAPLLVKVEDASSHDVVPGAAVSLIGASSCRFSGTTDSSGGALFNMANCTHFISQLKVSKSGYLTEIMTDITLSRVRMPDGSFMQRLDDVLVKLTLDSAVSTRAIISGHVITGEIGDPIEGATLQLFKADATALPIVTRTDSSGYYKFDNPGITGKLVLYSYKPGYKNTDSSAATFDFLGERANIDLMLQSLEEDESIDESFPILCLDSTTLKPVRDVKVNVRLEAQTLIDTLTGASGKEVVKVAAGKLIKISVEKNGQLQTREITLKKTTSLSPEELNNYLGLGVFLIGNAPGNNNKLEITVIDSATRAPISGAIINIQLPVPITRDSKIDVPIVDNYLATSYTFRTNTQGKIILPDDFSSDRFSTQLVSTADISIKNNFTHLLGSGQALHVSVTATNYMDNAKNIILSQTPLQSQVFELDPGVLGNSSMEISLANVNWAKTTSLSDALIKSNISLYRKTSTGNVRVPASKIGQISDVSDGSKLIRYDGIADGLYYSTFKNTEMYYNDGGTAVKPVYVRHSGARRENYIGADMFIVFCSESYAENYSFDPNIHFALEDSEDKAWFQANIDTFRQASHKFAETRTRLRNFIPITFIISSTSALGVGGRALPASVNLSCGWSEPTEVIFLEKSFVAQFISVSRLDLVISLMLHEYGHVIYGVQLRGTLFKADWDKLYLDIMSSDFKDCFMDRVKDSSLGVDPGRKVGHPDSNSNEAFASFFSDYFSRHYQFIGSIQACDSFSGCQNTLAYVWNIFSEKIGTTSDSDLAQFPALGGKIGNARYTFDEIRMGNWRQGRLRDLPIGEQIATQYHRLVSPVAASMVWTKLSGLINSFNSWLSQALNLTERNARGSLSGRVIDQNGAAMGNILIKVGDYYSGLSDASGNFSVQYIPAGTQTISATSSDRKNHTILLPSTGKVIIRSSVNRTMDIKITR